MNLFFKTILFLAFSLHSVQAQFDGETPALPVQQTDIYVRSNPYQQDFLYLCEGLVSYHANAYLNFPKEAFETAKNATYQKLSLCTNETGFTDLATAFTNKIKDGHTGLAGRRASGSGATFPMKCKYLHDSLVIMSVTDQLPGSFCGEKIKTINGVSLTAIEERTADIISVENYVSLQNTIMLSINDTKFLKLVGLIASDSASITIGTCSGREIALLPNSNGKWNTAFPAHPVTDKKSKAFSYRIIKEKQTCYLQINSFIDRRIADMYVELLPTGPRWTTKTLRFFGLAPNYPSENFDEFLDACITDMEKNNVTKVMVDLRNNPGGSADLGTMLIHAFGVDDYKSFSSEVNKSELYRIQMAKLTGSTDTVAPPKYDAKPTKRFRGRVYVATSEWSFSAAVMFATIVKDNKMFTLIGEPISERPSHFGEVLFLKLPNSKKVCSLSCKLFHRPDKSKDADETLYPDVPIYKTYETIKAGVDPVYEYVVAQ